jgi:hypothetical protein
MFDVHRPYCSLIFVVYRRLSNDSVAYLTQTREDNSVIQGVDVQISGKLGHLCHMMS